MAAGARTTFLTFAYGSNMLAARLRERCPSARPLGVARLPGHQLRWHKRSKDGSGKCNVVPGNVDQAVFGVVYEADARDRAALDQAEGLGHGYDQKDTTVVLNGAAVAVSIYVVTKIDPALMPYTWYKAMVISGAKENGLPTNYVASLEAVEASEDPDRARHDRNIRIIGATDNVNRA